MKELLHTEAEEGTTKHLECIMKTLGTSILPTQKVDMFIEVEEESAVDGAASLDNTKKEHITISNQLTRKLRNTIGMKKTSLTQFNIE